MSKKGGIEQGSELEREKKRREWEKATREEKAMGADGEGWKSIGRVGGRRVDVDM